MNDKNILLPIVSTLHQKQGLFSNQRNKTGKQMIKYQGSGNTDLPTTPTADFYLDISLCVCPHRSGITLLQLIGIDSDIIFPAWNIPKIHIRTALPTYYPYHQP